MEGMIPFNRNALWAKRADLLLRTSTGQSVDLSTTPSSFGPPASATPQAAPPVDATSPAGAAPPAGVAPDPLPEDEDLPLVLGHITERVQEAIDYIRKKIDIGQLTQGEIMAHLIRLQESSDIVADFAATKAEKSKADKQCITAAMLFRNKGGATGPESRKLLADKQAQTQANEEEEVARNEERNQAKAHKVAHEVTKGA